MGAVFFHCWGVVNNVGIYFIMVGGFGGCCKDKTAVGNRVYTNDVRLRGLKNSPPFLQPAEAGFVCVDAVSNRRVSNRRVSNRRVFNRLELSVGGQKPGFCEDI
ncbi:MAG: hypothetical protein EAZ33_20850 [Oscillatoriales cyanobacterium]|nr:MAG: hypothetical protein EAZ33_20850 [Oscillatoriales cyanobacterium]